MKLTLGALFGPRNWLLADGATGTNLHAMGLSPGAPPELWNCTEPDRIRALHRRAVVAGADIFLTNTFGGNAARLRFHGAEEHVLELNRAGAALGREVADAAGRPVLVAGSIGPTGENVGPRGTLTVEAAAEIFAEQIEGLIAGGVDLLWVETISNADELQAAARAVSGFEVAWACSMSFHNSGRLMTGMAPAEMVGLVHSLDPSPVAFGANCGSGPLELLHAVKDLARNAAELPIIAKSNAGLPRLVEGCYRYDASPDLMAEYAILARDCGAAIIGGCCGTEPAHLEAMKARLDAEAPSREALAERLARFAERIRADEPGRGC